MLSYHFYPRNYGFTTARDTEIWIERHQAIAALTGKVAYLGECGFVAPDQERGQTYDNWLRHLFAQSDGQLGLLSGVVAVMVGLLESYTSFWLSAYKEVLVFSLLIPVLLWRSLSFAGTEEEEAEE